LADLHLKPGYIGALAVLTAGTLQVDIRRADEVLTGDLG
jgi:hypothetical protein